MFVVVVECMCVCCGEYGGCSGFLLCVGGGFFFYLNFLGNRFALQLLCMYGVGVRS